ncbi:SusC/RagA family TonB-linked outer membrane protein [Flavilitoribacter nigricans]|uniref:SusC/RagA family TonB-linked outer membrane protein n=1 Tax=Flavilitoribacter nigricans (strain ATCC 23147 / DSM 23189 / NBRC 102662 / NCIMB 1420 / SS-2) TaxID=1122177 RepID=A0A2D0NGI2_FLAN2|nr:SusC/RagA family TonB-linked outer membrane protein [Flavilitoribacter nigricans]PHN07279.1 SusC/RagA family TonB-linked outer membrane protein [Flavilitoribacter nigricans DSM 23189 = NBRC 102662]
MMTRLHLLLILCMSGAISLYADRPLEGIITDGNEPLIGATVLVKGTAKGTITDFEGKFELMVAEDAEMLIVSYTGYETMEVAIGSQSYLEIILKETEITLGEVVVTALGVEREKKALGYAVQDVDASELAKARSTNVVNGLSGRVAGIQITAANAPGGGSQVTIRGNASILGNNQPLYVIDGVPMEGDFAAPISNADDNNVYGGGVSEISPDNIESITVLKGANAAALYGSRAANGVVLITTKTGAGTEGISVDYTGGYTVEDPLVVPTFQDTYGGGNGYVTWYADGRNGGITDPLAVEQFQAAYGTDYPLNGTAGVDESWGAPMDGRLVRTWWSGTEVAPLVPVPDSWSNLWETGSTINNSVGISSTYSKGNFRFAFGNLRQKGILYNNDYRRDNYRFNITHNLTDKLSVKVSSEYIKSGSDNRQQPAFWEPQTWHHRHDDWGKLKDWKQFMGVHITREGDEYPYANWQHSFAMNRFYEQEFLTHSNDKDRFLGNIALTYEFTPALSLMVRTGTDLWTDTRVNVTRHAQIKSGTLRTEAFNEDVLRRQESNSDFIFTFNKYIGQDLSVNAQFGGANRTNYYKRNYTAVNDVTINGLYNVANNATTNTNRSRIEEKEVNSLFGALSFGYRSFLYLDITGRNDWSSTLPVANNSYFYPSFSLSTVLTEMLQIQSPVLSYAKVRASWAQVGNDTDPYRLSQIFNPRDPWNASTPVFSESTAIANNDLKPERTTGIEFGADLRFFGARLGLDVTYYNQTTTDQIINIAVSKATGYDSKVINAGEITNKGIEAVLYGTLFKQKDFTWDVAINFAKNNNQIVDLYTDANGNELETIVLTSRRGLSLEARVGQPYGTLFGSAYLRVPDGPNAGQIIFKDGIPQVDPNLQIIGNVTPDFLGGIQNSISWKNFSISALIDAKIGGDIADESSSTGMQTGIYPITALGREEGVIGIGVKNIGSEENPEYVPNDVVAPTKSVTRMLSVRSVNEGAIYDATYVKLREVSISYALPNTLMNKIGFVKSARLSLVGRNLAMIYNGHHQIDPELNIFGGNLQGALYYATLPSTRSVGVNLNVVF